jgi:hypothetical protein
MRHADFLTQSPEDGNGKGWASLSEVWRSDD